MTNDFDKIDCISFYVVILIRILDKKILHKCIKIHALKSKVGEDMVSSFIFIIKVYNGEDNCVVKSTNQTLHDLL